MSVSRGIRVAVAVGLTAYILWRVDPRAVLASTAGAEWLWLGAAVALVAVDRTLMAYRWLVLLRGLTPGSQPSFRAVLRVFFVSTFVGTFLPSIGGDLYRAYSLSRLQVSAGESAASVLMDRILGILSIAMLGAGALLPARDVLSGRAVLPILGAALLVCLAAAVAVFSARVAAAGQAVAGRVPSARAQRLAASLLAAIRRYARHRGRLVLVLGLSLLVQVIRVVQAYFLGVAIGIAAPLALYFVFVPIILLIMLLPVTVNGLGTSQAAFAWLFGAAGVAAPAAVALSILFVALGAVGNLPGGILYLLGSQPATIREETS